MPRTARVVVPGVAHHVTQRGNNRQEVFFTDADRRFYLNILREQAEERGLAVTAYCLMPNHVHLIVTPRAAESLARTVGTTHLIYAQYINRMHDRSGHLWQSRFYSCPLDAPHEVAAVRYAERNPVRAQMVRSAWQYRWSSAATHVGEPDECGLLDLAKWRRRYGAAAWRKILGDPLDEQMTGQLRAGMSAGRALGSDKFIAKLETQLRRRLRPLPRGRPRKRMPG
jgi:REP-associated tyrosine transposase